MINKKIGIVVTASNESFHLVRTSIFHFIDKNKWFTGKIFVLVDDVLSLSKNNIEILLAIYAKIEIIIISDKQVGIKLGDSTVSQETLIKTLSTKIFSSEVDEILYFSMACLFVQNIQDLIQQNKVINSNYVIHLHRGEEVSNLGKTISSEFVYSSFFMDHVFSKKRSHLNAAYCIIFDTSHQSQGSKFTKIHQIWLQANHRTFQFLNGPREINRSLVKSHSNPVEMVSTSCEDTNMSIIIPAFRANAYIKECLDSIYSQNSKTKFEVLIGIDNCEDTLAALNKIKENYQNLTIFTSSNKVGPYVIRNTLVNFSKYSNLLFFDADDIMMPELMSSVLMCTHSSSYVRFRYIEFKNKNKLNTTRTIHKNVAHGVFFISKSLFNKIGGFQNWLCGADTEFMIRCEKNMIIPKNLKQALFYRRVHALSLTQNSLTGHKSIVRSRIQKLINTTTDWRIPINRQVTSLFPIK